MKCCIIIILFLSVGSHWCQESQEQDESPHEISLDAFSLISSQLDFIEEMCFNRTESFTVFDKLEDAIAECQTMMLNGTALSLSFDALTTTDPREFYELYKIQCNNEEAIQLREKCNNKLKVLLGECLNETEIEAFSKIENIAQRVYDVICSIDEEKMKNFFSAKGQECLVDNVITIGFCFLTTIPDNPHDKQEMLFNLIEGRECKAIDEIENCIMTGIEACEEKTISHIFNLLFEFFRNELSCTATATSPKHAQTVTASGSVIKISILLLTSNLIATL